MTKKNFVELQTAHKGIINQECLFCEKKGELRRKKKKYI